MQPRLWRKRKGLEREMLWREALIATAPHLDLPAPPRQPRKQKWGGRSWKQKPKSPPAPTGLYQMLHYITYETICSEGEGRESPMHTPTMKKSSAAVSNLLDRPSLARPASPALDMDLVTSSQILREKDIQPSKLNFGFLGLGIMGSGIVKNLLNSGHTVTVWNRTVEKVTVIMHPCIQNNLWDSGKFFMSRCETLWRPAQRRL